MGELMRGAMGAAGQTSTLYSFEEAGAARIFGDGKRLQWCSDRQHVTEGAAGQSRDGLHVLADKITTIDT